MKPYDLLFDETIRSTVGAGLRILRDFPESREAVGRVLAHLPKAASRRSALGKRGMTIPPLLIISTTEQCNLSCAGCYARANCREAQPELSRTRIDALLDEAVDAGCCMILLAGGEPLLRPDWLEAVSRHSELLGLVFTNGTLLDERMADWFSGHRNMAPLFSVEGSAQSTDARRGSGVAARVERAMALLSERSIPFGLSITTGEHNIDEVAQADFLAPYRSMGCRLAVFTEYVPVDNSDALRALTDANKARLQTFCTDTSARSGMLLVAFPGDETAYGGCLAAGRGFAHISAGGALEPCPFAAHSDRSVINGTLLEALASPLLARIRAESHLLHEGAGGCALRARSNELSKWSMEG